MSFVKDYREGLNTILELMKTRTTFLCAFEEDVLVGCSTLQVDERDGCKFRIRGMAVLPDHRNKGIGSNIVKGLQEYAKSQGSGIWCNARVEGCTDV